MGISIVTPPTVTPISVMGLDDLKRHLRESVDVNDENDLLTDYCWTAWQYAELITWRQLLTATLQLTMPFWRSQNCDFDIGGKTRILLPRGPVTGVTSVEYYDDDNALQTLAESEYDVDLTADVVEIVPSRDASWPSTYQRPDSILITYTAGYGTTAAAMPPVLRQAVRLLVADYFETREPAQVDTTTVDGLLELIACRDDRLASMT